MIDSNTVVKCQDNEREISIQQENRNKMADISQINMEEIIRVYSEEEMVRMIKEIMENNAIMLKLQKQVAELKVVEKERKSVTNFIQLVSPQLVDQFSQTKLHWKALNESYPHICGIYKSNNK